MNQFAVKWIRSQAKKGEEKYDGVWSQEAPERPILTDDLGLVLKSKAKHAAIATRLTKPFVFADKPLVVQYEVQLQVCEEFKFFSFLKKNILKNIVFNLKFKIKFKLFFFHLSKDGQDCGGSYIKLLSAGKETVDLKTVSFNLG